MLNPLEDNLVDQSSPEPLVLIKTDSPYFTVVQYNSAFSKVSRTTDMDIIGKSIMELHNWNSNNEESALLIYDLLIEAITKKETITLPAVRYDLPAEGTGEPETEWWQAIYKPILAADDSVEFLLCITRNITQQMQDRPNETVDTRT